MTHRLSIHSMLRFLAILFCLFPIIIYAGRQKGQLNANHPKGQLNANHPKGQLNADHSKGQLNADHSKGQLNADHQKGQLNADHQKGQLKIRLHSNKEHAYVVIGDHYEYDYLEKGPPRRSIVRKEKAEKAKPEDKAKSMLGNANREFDVAKADEIFYKMVTQEGWFAMNFSWKNSRFCRSFAYEFVCKLFNGECPKQEEWPEEFVKADLVEPQSVFLPAYKDAREHFKIVEDESGCHLKDFELKIKLFGKYTVFDSKTNLTIEITPKDISHLIVQIQTRKVKYSSDERMVNTSSGEYIELTRPLDSFTTEEWAVKVDGHENILKTKIKVFVCPGGHSYFENLRIFNHTGFLLWHEISDGDLKDEKHKVIKIDISEPPTIVYPPADD